MANVKFSPIIADLRGKFGGFTFGKSKDKNYIKYSPDPKTTDAPSQQVVQNAYGRLVSLWRSLANQPREAWERYAYDHSISGFASFIQKNLALEIAGTTLVYTPQNPEVHPAADIDFFYEPVVDAVRCTWYWRWTFESQSYHIACRYDGEDVFTVLVDTNQYVNREIHYRTGADETRDFQGYLTVEASTASDAQMSESIGEYFYDLV